MTMTGNADADARLISELAGLRTDIQNHAKADAEALGGIHTRLDAIATEQARLATAVSDASATARQAKDQAQKIDVAHAADVAARAGSGDALERQLVRAQLDSLPERQEVELAIQKARADAELKIKQQEAASRARLRVQLAKGFVVFLTIVAAAIGGAKWQQESTPAPAVGVPSK